MNKLWIRNGKFVSDEYGRPLVCPICPCVTCEEKIEWLRHLATVYGGTFYGEGYIRTPDIEELFAPAVEVFQAAMIYAVTVNEVTTLYIITVGCGDDCPLGKRVLRDRESYIEKDGVCECPSLATFIENAQFAGYEVFGESVLIAREPNPYNWGFYKVRACYFDTNKNDWIGYDCFSCRAIDFSGIVWYGPGHNALRFDHACDDCFDIRSFILGNPEQFGLIEYQYGSHTCYESNGIRHVFSISGLGEVKTEDINIVSYVDYRVLIALFEQNGQRFLFGFQPGPWDVQPLPWGVPYYRGGRRVDVPSDTVLSGYAKLLRYWKYSEVGGYDNDPCIAGNTLLVMTYAPYELTEKKFLTEEEAIDWSNQLIPIEDHYTAIFSNMHTSGWWYGSETLDRREQDCDAKEIEYHQPYYDPRYNRWIAYKARYRYVSYCLRFLRTNRGIMMLDGSMLESITTPPKEYFVSCTNNGISDIDEWGTTLNTKYGKDGRWDDYHPEDYTCPEIDPEEFE